MSATYKGHIKFVPVKNGDTVDLGDTGLLGISGAHKFLGFKPGRAGKPEGWLVFLIRGTALNPKKRRRS
jgi:hypothetical protein